MAFWREAMITKDSQKIFNNSIFYSIGTVLSKAVGFFLVPIYTYFLSSEDYGIGTTLTNFVSTFGIVIMLSLRAAMIRFYNDYDRENQRRFVGTILTFVLINAVVICSLLCIAHPIFVPLFFKGIAFFPYVFWGVLSLGMEGIYLVYQSLMQARQDGKRFSQNSIVYLFFHFFTVVLFVAVLKMDALGMILSCFVTNFCFAAYGVISMIRKGFLIFCLDKEMLVKSLKYSIPILPHNLSNNLNTYSVKLIINHFIGYAMSGLYTLASQFSSIVNMVQNSVNLAFRPWFIEQMQNGEEGRGQIKHMSCMIMSLLAFCCVGVSLFSKEIIVLLAEKTYVDAWLFVPVLILGQLISYIYFCHVQTLMYNVKMSKYVVVCSFSSLLSNIMIALILVEKLEIYAILISLIISKTVLCAISVVMSNIAENVDFGLWNMVRQVGYYIGFSVIGIWISLKSGLGISLGAFSIKVLLTVAAVFVFLAPFRADYFKLLRGFLKKDKT